MIKHNKTAAAPNFYVLVYTNLFITKHLLILS